MNKLASELQDLAGREENTIDAKKDAQEPFPITGDDAGDVFTHYRRRI